MGLAVDDAGAADVDAGNDGAVDAGSLVSDVFDVGPHTFTTSTSDVQRDGRTTPVRLLLPDDVATPPSRFGGIVGRVVDRFDAGIGDVRVAVSIKRSLRSRGDVETTTAEDGFEPCLQAALTSLFDPNDRSIRGEPWNQAVRFAARIQ